MAEYTLAFRVSDSLVKRIDAYGKAKLPGVSSIERGRSAVVRNLIEVALQQFEKESQNEPENDTP